MESASASCVEIVDDFWKQTKDAAIRIYVDNWRDFNVHVKYFYNRTNGMILNSNSRRTE
jgi:hypothetical protein